jgi:hypothetical protein
VQGAHACAEHLQGRRHLNRGDADEGSEGGGCRLGRSCCLHGPAERTLHQPATNGWSRLAGGEDGSGELGSVGRRSHGDHRCRHVKRRASQGAEAPGAATPRHRPKQPLHAAAVSLPTMDFSLVQTRMDGGRLDPARQRLASEKMKEGAVGRPDLVADAGEDNGGRRSGRRQRHCVPFRHWTREPPSFEWKNITRD